MTLPQPGPGRPHHNSYIGSGPQASLLELLILVLGLALVGYSVVEVWAFLGGLV